MAEQQLGSEPPNKRAKMDAFPTSDPTDDFAAMLENALPDDLMWSGDSQGGGGGGGGGVNGMMEGGGGGGGGGPGDRPQQLTHLLQTKTPPHSMAGNNAMTTGPHSMPNQSNMIVNALTNSKSPHGGPMQSPQNSNLGMSGVPTSSQQLTMSDSVNNLNTMPNSIANSMAANVTGTMSISMASSGAVSSMSLVNTNTSMGLSSMANSAGMAGGMNTVSNINTMNTINSINKSQCVVTTMNMSGPMASQMNDGMPNGPLPGLNRPMVPPNLRGQSPQPMGAVPQGMAPRHPGMGPGHLGQDYR
nr:hybrid signal transduction histidine kinase M-like [Cherax quadricarinatus]